MDTIVIMLNSATFELRLSPHDSRWYVISATPNRSATAQAIVGMGFTVGDNPLLWSKGYACSVQRELNKRFKEGQP